MPAFIVSARLLADASGLKAGAAQGKAALDSLGAAAESNNRATARMSAEQFRAVQGITAFARATNNLESGLGRSTAALTRNASASRQHQFAVRQLGLQVGDVTQQLALGQNALIVFGQQANQVAGAAAGLGGRLGSFATFMSGPFGAAITAGITVLGLFASGMFRSSQETERAEQKSLDFREAINFQRMTTQELVGAINQLDQAQRRTIQTGIQAEAQTLRNAQAMRTQAIELLRAAQAQIRYNLALARETDSLAIPGEIGEQQARIGSAARGEVARLEAEIRTLDAALATIGQNIRRARIPQLQREVSESVDASERASGNYERTLGRLNAQLSRNAITEQQYTQQLRAARQARDAATEASRRGEQQERRTSSTRSFGGRNISTERDVRGALEGAGFQINSGFRTPEHNRAVGGAANSYHLTGRAFDIAKSGGASLARIREVVTGLGLSIRELIDEGDHFHVAFSGAMDGAARSTHAADQAVRQLNTDLATFTRQFDPATAAATEYEETLARIVALEAAGLSPERAQRFRAGAFNDYTEALNRVGQQEAEQRRRFIATLTPEMQQALTEGATRAGPDIRDVLVDVTSASMEAFRERGVEAARLIGQAFGGHVGRSLENVFGILAGVQTGNFQGVGGRVGAILNLVTNGGQTTGPLAPLRDAFEPIRRGFDRLLGTLDGIFGGQGSFTRVLGKATGFSVIGDSVARATGGSGLGGAVGGALGGFGGEALGGILKSTLGSLSGLAGPLGSILGGVLGGVLGKALAGHKTGSTTITSVEGQGAVSGTDAASRSQSGKLAGSVQGALSQIAEQFGGALGSFAVSIGIRDGKFRVDPSGRGVTKTKKGALDFGKDEGAAIMAAIADAIADGAITGLSAAVQRALQSSTDVDKAIREAVKVDEVETLLKGLGGTLEKQFRVFETQAVDRVRIATKYGFDVVKIEELNAKERLKLLDDVLATRIGSLKDLLNEINFGDLFEGSLSDRRTKLIAEFDKAVSDAAAGIEGAADRQAQLSRDLLALSREAFGTAGPEFGSDLERARTSAERVIQLENERVKAAADASRETNAHLDENNSQNAVMIARLESIDSGIAALLAGGSLSGSAADTSRQVSLTL